LNGNELENEVTMQDCKIKPLDTIELQLLEEDDLLEISSRSAKPKDLERGFAGTALQQ
jgi:hypothetical protein